MKEPNWNNQIEQAILKLHQGNAAYAAGNKSDADISQLRREDTAASGQKPYAVIVTCSDSRVPPEHIFSAGVGDLFVVRTAGNVIGDFELGSIEYGAEHLGAKVVVILGHSGCGAVSAAMSGHAGGYIESIVNEIKPGIAGAGDAPQAERLNIEHSYNQAMKSQVIKELVDSGGIALVQAKYDIHTGKVEFFE